MQTVESFLEVNEIDVKRKFYSRHCSMIFLRAKILSMQPLPFLNPACSSLSLESIAAPRQLSQVLRLPFLGSFTIRPLAQSSGTVSDAQMEWKKSVRTSADALTSAFSISAWMLSTPQAFPFFRALMVVFTFSLLGGLVSMSRRTSDGSISAGSSGSGLLRTSRKCSTHCLFTFG